MNYTQKLHTTDKKQETAVLVALATSKQSIEKTKEYLDELAFLAETSGVKTLHRFTQKLDKPDSRTFVGKGKLEEITAFVKDKAVDMVIFDDDLSPSQVRNLETELQCKILDRSLLILNIFSIRAQTSQAKTQVELAQYQYLLPRLTRMWSHLSKQKGGIGMRGPGEKELETDRRIVRDKISLLRDKLDKIEKQGFTQRKSRDKMVRVALVGYTNVGKSTLMRLVSKTDVFAENKLFATVDSTVRKVVFNQIPFLLTDTVGFIRKLPTTLVESFKSTLDEIREADLLLHVVDASHSSYEEQIDIVNTTLAEIAAADKPTILVFNKIDLLAASSGTNGHLEEDEQDTYNVEHQEGHMSLEGLKDSVMNHHATDTVFISAEKGLNMDALRELLLEKVSQIHYTIFPNYLKDQVFSGENGQ
ncbi:GTPase HflX [Rhodocytophaga rosea]|uniref:GTPase HflX n=1 Tax=Rhodocytophaga rosea TaxID=2704465 RepID=A0A6C0GK87_9BACT|nr:GTPase HflX [Rhodocytophaga rosea]QHT68093.1 GTPase HflX [Rhodocytophaga rosea]